MRISRFHFIFGAAFVLAFALLHWLLVIRSSPLYSYLLYHEELRNLWIRIHTGPFLIAIILSGNVHQPSSVIYFAAAASQWFIAGFLLSFVFTGFRVRRP
jgi:hypothetical protein